MSNVSNLLGEIVQVRNHRELHIVADVQPPFYRCVTFDGKTERMCKRDDITVCTTESLLKRYSGFSARSRIQSFIFSEISRNKEHIKDVAKFVRKNRTKS